MSLSLDGVALASCSAASVDPIVNLDIAEIASVPLERMRLYDGSVIRVQREPKRYVSVMGLVRLPKKIEMPDGEDPTLLSAIAEAGGTTLYLADKVYITRPSANSPTPVVVEASLSDARSGGKSNLLLADGDSVTVAETPPTVIIQAIQTVFNFGFNAWIREKVSVKVLPKVGACGHNVGSFSMNQHQPLKSNVLAHSQNGRRVTAFKRVDACREQPIRCRTVSRGHDRF